MICFSVHNGNKGETDRTTDTLFKDGDPQNTSLLGGTYLSSPYMGVHHPYSHTPPPPPPPPPPPHWDFNPMSHDTCKNFHQDSWVAFKWTNFFNFFKGITVFPRENKDNVYMHFFFFSWGLGAWVGGNERVLWEMRKWPIVNANWMQFHRIFYLAVRKMGFNPPRKSQEIDENGLLE